MRRRYYRRRKGTSNNEQPFFSEQSASVQTKETKVPFFQTKEDGLKVGQPGDKYEVEADAMADAVVGNSSNSVALQRKEISGIQLKCDGCEEEGLQTKIQLQADEEPEVQTQATEEEVQMQTEEEEVQMQAEEEEEVQMQAEEEEEIQMQTEEENLQTKEEEEVQMQAEDEELQTKVEDEEVSTKLQTKSNRNSRTSSNISSRIQQSSGKGKPLPKNTQRNMEAAFGVDFTKVNIHTNSEAVQMNKKLHSQAFTHGNDIYFNQGKYQPESGAGKHLLAHELTHVVQQNKDINKKVQPKLVYGGGYKGYANTSVEVGKAKSGDWNPTTKDFKKNASRSGGGQSAKNLSGLLGILKKAPKNSIKRLDLIGHSNSKALGLGGDVHSPGVPLTGVISSSTLSAKKTQINAIKDRFSEDAVITLYSCNSGGSGGGLLDAVSKAFGVCAKGFSNSVFWCITWNNTPLKITSRGKVFYADPNDPLANFDHPDCADFNNSVHDLSPDIESCAGAKKKKDDKKCVLPDELIPVQSLFSPVSFEFSELNRRSVGIPQPSNSLVGLRHGDGLEMGSQFLSPRVKELQNSLNRHGSSLQTDGKFGKNTLKFLQQLQHRMGIPISDTVGELTATALGLDPAILGKVPIISSIEGLKRGDGLVWGTWHLRSQVKKLQLLLGIQGFTTNPDGMFGPNTESKLKGFQKSQEIAESNIVDRTTADKLEGRNITLCPSGGIPLLV